MARLAWLGPLALLAACGGDASEAAQTSDTAQAAAPAAAPAGGSLSAYVGKWPFDQVNGYTWNQNPTVRAAVARTVTDQAARDAILTVDGPSSAIVMKGGKVTAWGCQQHDCGAHQWLVQITPDGSAADICYFKAGRNGGKARIFSSDGRVRKGGANCNP